MLKIGIIGGGNMGTAIISRTFKKYRIAVCEQDPARAAVLKKKFRASVMDLKTLAQNSDIIILAVKPQDMGSVLSQLKESLTRFPLVISIAAGLSIGYFQKFLGKSVRVIRTMPNMPAQIGEAVTALCKSTRVTEKDLKSAVDIFSCIGQTVIVDEKWIDSVTAVSGSGPAYLFLFVECFLKAAQKTGLSAQTAQKLVDATLSGSVNLYLQSKQPAGSLRDKVTSKGGTTQAALEVFAANHFEKMFVNAVSAAKARAKELAR